LRDDHGVQMITDLLCEAEIIAASIPVAGPRCGIYFLIRDGRVMYVGQSVNIDARIATHYRSPRRKFDGWHWLPCEPSALDALERRYLDALLPPWNADPETARKRGDVRERAQFSPLPHAAHPLDGVDPNWWIGLPAEDLGEGQEEYEARRDRMLRVRAMRRSQVIGAATSHP
jgi:hypothetical protein